LGDQTGLDALSGLAALTARHQIRGIAWEDRLIHATDCNRRHALVAG
jgi:hypothetical protein